MKEENHDVSKEASTTVKEESSPKKRKRPRTAAKRAPTAAPTTTTTTTLFQQEKPLSGLIVAVSTLLIVKEGRRQVAHRDGVDSSEESSSSFAAVSDLCKNGGGATLSNQVHKNVAYVVCNPSAVVNATQRVRKALKKNIPLVHVSWVRQCIKEKQLVDDEPYRLDDLARKHVSSIVEVKNKQQHSHVQEDEDTACNNTLEGKDELNGIPDEAWSEPVSLGCCCVCHENDGTDDGCPWCEDCDVTNKARKRQKK